MKTCLKIRCIAAVSAVLITCISAQGATIAEFDFDDPSNPTANLGLGPHGSLMGGASVADGRLMVNGLDQALDIPLGDLNPFGGSTDWNVAFDFATEGSSGALFSSDGSFEPFPGEQAGSLNLFVREGTVVMDFWYIGEISTETAYNDNQSHRVEASYDALTGIATLTVDGSETVVSEDWSYSRDVLSDRTRVGDETNGDFGIDFNEQGFTGWFDNVVITGTPAIPEPSSGSLLLLGSLFLGRRVTRQKK